MASRSRAALTRRRGGKPVPRGGAPAADPAVVSYTPRHQSVAQLTREILILNSRANRSDCQARLAIGALLAQVQLRLGPSSWLEWLGGALPFTPRTAYTYIQLHRWADANPVVYQQLAPLGPSKLTLLTRLAPGQLGKLLRRKLHSIPTTNDKRTLQLMTVPELALVIAAIQGTLPPPSPTADMALHNYQRRIHSLANATEALTAYDTLPREAIHELHDALLQTAAELAEAFALEA